jgi:flagellar biosynthesis/type III secretory pathway protein FliH
MTSFCIDTIHIDPSLRPQHGVLRVAALAVTSDARHAAQRIIDEANAQAEAIVQQAQEEAQEHLRTTQEDTLQQAAELLRGLEEANAALLDRVQPVVIDLVQNLFARMAMKATPRKQIETSLRRLLDEVPSKLVNPVLRVHPDDVGLLPEVEWEVVPDANLVPGTCLLQADSGEWRADYAASVTALTAALSQVSEMRSDADDVGDDVEDVNDTETTE